MNASDSRPENHLAGETSPYLLQHVRNPVDWHPWGEKALEKAKLENKLLLISIGYSACHWCHVMERESFEDEETARIMNADFVCIKVDREERPDIDQVYMHAVQLITGQGGWPLNCFALPDGRPIYGGTYFRNAHFKDVLRTLATLYRDDTEKVVDQAEELTRGVRRSDSAKPAQDLSEPTREEIAAVYTAFAGQFDNKEGGPNRAPKFPLPNNYRFLLRFGYQSGNEEALQHVNLTLEKMAFGGIFDQIGGGFSRYSTDYEWKVPHFEKMLYDNGQLLELYAEAYQASNIPLYADTVYAIADFVERELTSPEGGFYSALDADSEGVEGKYYVWTREELQSLLGNDFALFAEYYNVNSQGYWEEGNHIPLRKLTDTAFAAEKAMSVEDLRLRISAARERVFGARTRRVRPGLDDKILTSWNALMSKGLITAYCAFKEERFLESARVNLAYLLEKAVTPDGGLYHNGKDGRFNLNGYLEDYAFIIEALLSLYQATFEPSHLDKARELTEYALENFSDPDSPLFFFTSRRDPALVARKKEIMDNVIPASNSSMARNLFLLADFFDEPRYRDRARAMLDQVRREMRVYGTSFSNWALLAMDFAYPFYEVVVAGPDAEKRRSEIARHYLPHVALAGGEASGHLPLLKDRNHPTLGLIHVCRQGACNLPVTSVEEALGQLGTASIA